MILMAISNAEGRLLLSTGNKSELAVGYCTLYGDTNGGLAVLGDVLKDRGLGDRASDQSNRPAARSFRTRSSTKSPLPSLHQTNSTRTACRHTS